MESAEMLRLEALLDSLNLNDNSDCKTLEEKGGEVLKRIPSKKIFLIAFKRFAVGKIDGIGNALWEGITVSQTRNDIAAGKNILQKKLGKLEIILITKRLSDILEIPRNGWEGEADLVKALKNLGITNEEISLLREEVSNITLEEIMEATGITQEQIDSVRLVQ
ncbi:MAG: hypothetical protein PHY86_02310 [Candidatus Gracilibacteria bacterium]|nr:hypothetical protein [Candidatus Gracilibacteria bacterium]